MSKYASNWAADDTDSDSDTGPQEVLEEVTVIRGDEVVAETVLKYRASFVEHPSTHARHLYTLFGQLIVDDNGDPLNVWTSRFNDYLKRTVHHVHVPGRPGFGVFLTSKKHMAYLRDALETGYSEMNTAFHIYPDEKGWVQPTPRSVRSR